MFVSPTRPQLRTCRGVERVDVCAGVAEVHGVTAGRPVSKHQRGSHAGVRREGLCRRVGRVGEARKSFERALSLTRQEPERRFLMKRIGDLSVSMTDG